MAIKQYLKRALSLPPHVVLLIATKMLILRARNFFSRWRDRYISSYSHKYDGSSSPNSLFRHPPSHSVINKYFPEHPFLVKKILSHEFDLLGSGWTHLSHHTIPQGCGGFLYEDLRTQRPVVNKSTWIKKYINKANQQDAERIWSKLPSSYSPIDWHKDFKSGYRWSENTWWADIRYGHKPGVDIKIPWEISRAQHLPQLAMAFGNSQNSLKLSAEFENQVLDFISSNPPRFGVNWRCTMDVAIRAANWVLAYEFLRMNGYSFSSEFKEIFLNSVWDHGNFIYRHLEISGDGYRGNHYLANVTGLLYIALFLPRRKEVQTWLEYAKNAILKETSYQFFPDGSNFEGSTVYHRLSGEMVLYGTLALESYGYKLPNEHFQKIFKMGEFLHVLRRPDGLCTQIGDCDNGRFFKIRPLFVTVNSLKENHLNIDGFVDAAWAISDQHYIPSDLEGIWIRSLFSPSAAIPRQLSPTPAFTDLSALKEILPPDIYSVLKDKNVDSPSSLHIPANFSQRFHRYPFSDTAKHFEMRVFKEFGLVVWRSEQFYLTFRCGPIGQQSRGGHDHNDQLSCELFIGDKCLLNDPGTGIYTPLPDIRNLYRSVSAHSGPHILNEHGTLIEPGPLDQGLFSLKGNQESQLICATSDLLIGYNKKLRSLRIIKRLEKELYFHDICIEPSWKIITATQSLNYSFGYGDF